jgi:hypothetical protein
MTKYSKQPIVGEFRDICAGAIAGLMGSGKTTTASFIAAQVVIKGGKIAIIDPHGNAHITVRKETLSYNLEPLEPAYLGDVAIEEDDIIATVELVNDILRERKRGSAADWPLMMFIDEFSSLMRSETIADVIIPLLEDIATEGRKFLVGAMLLGQQWHAARSGGGPLRDVLGSAYVHRMRRKIARMLVDDIEDTSNLRDGEAWLYRSQFGITRVQVPLTTYSDLIQVGSLLKPRKLDPVSGTAKLEINPSLSHSNAPNRVMPAEPIKRRIIERFIAGENVRQIAREVFKVSSGTPYNEAFDEVNNVIREYLLGDMIGANGNGHN